MSYKKWPPASKLAVELTEDEVNLLQGLIAHDLAHLLVRTEPDDARVTELMDLYVRVGNKLGMNL